MDKLTDTCEIEFADDAGVPAPTTTEIINSVVKPIRPVKPEDVYVRTMFVTSDRLNSQGGRFEPEGIEQLCRLIPGAPVLIGHDKRRLPIARCFRSELVDRNGHSWVKVWFYWLRAADGSDTLLENIDGGIYSECSLGFSFRLPECSICGGDIRRCSHVPGREYRGESGEIQLCHFIYRTITRVNEISLVYRGAVPGTAIADQVLNTDSKPCTDRIAVFAFGNEGVALSLRSAAPGERQIIFPGCPTALLDSGRSLIGYTPTESRPGSGSELIDSTSVEVLENAKDGVRFKSYGWYLNGEYILRPAILRREKVMLLYRYG